MKSICLLATLSVLTLGLTDVSAQRSSFSSNLPIEGFSQPGRLAKIATSARGILLERCVEEGHVVKAGDCIANIDDTVQQKLVEMARVAKDSTGEISAAEASLTASRALLSRITGLTERNHASQIELVKAKEQLATAESNLQIAKENQLQRLAEYEKLMTEANQFRVKAPFDGIVVEYLKEHGEYVGPTDPHVCVLVQLETLSVEFLVPLVRRHEFTTGHEAAVLFVDSGATALGTISYISPYPNGETNLFTVKVRVANEKRKLRAGMRCHLQKVQQRPEMASSGKPQSQR